jgi:general nucleoside transport system permease protein
VSRIRFALLVLGSLAVVMAALFASGVPPLEAVQRLFTGSLGSPAAISATIRETTPLLIAGVAVFLALRAGLFNIGVEGQLVVGAMCCATVALAIPTPAGMLLGTMAGIAAGALWALPAGLIKAYKGGHEVITTIMLNRVAVLGTAALVAGPLRDPAQQATTTALIGEGARIPLLVESPPVMVSSAILLGLLAIPALAFWLRRTVPGFELQAVGANATAAEVAGIDPRKVIVRAMMASGALGGLAGSVMVLAYEYRFYENFSPGYGFDALGVALLAGSSALGVLPAALLFGILARGSTSIAIMGVPRGLTYVILGLLIIIAASLRYRKGAKVG